MSDQTITYLTDVFLITCIVQVGRADDILKAARDAGARGAIVYHAKGTGVRERLGLLGVAVEAEKEVVSIIVSAEQRSWVFNSIYKAGKLDTPGIGFMYTIPLEKVATYIPESVVAKLEQQG